MSNHRVFPVVWLCGAVVLGLCSELRAQAPEESAAIMLRLRSDVPEVRAAAALELGAQGKYNDAALRQLGLLLTDESPRVRRAAIVALRRLAVEPAFAVPPLTQMLADPDPAVAAQAAALLENYGEAIVPAVVRSLANEDARYWAALVLASLGPKAREAVPALLEVIDSPEPEVRREVIMALGAIGPDARGAVPVLVEQMKSDDKALLLSTTYALGGMGEAAQPATPALRDQLQQTEDVFLRAVTAWALASLNPGDESLQRQMLSILGDALSNPQDRQARIAAARALVLLRPPHNVLLPELTRVLKNSPPEVTRDALLAFAAVGRPAVPSMVRMLQYEDMRPLVARVLAALGAQAAEAVPALAEVLPKSEPLAQREILMTLAAIGPPAQAAVPQIVPLLKSDNPQARYGAAYALGRIGPPAVEAVPNLMAQLTSDDSFYRVTSAWALSHIAPRTPEVARAIAPILAGALRHERPFVRIEAAEALGRLGPAAGPAIPELERMATNDPNERARKTAAAALGKIGV
jgi:HEAT repeat protein